MRLPVGVPQNARDPRPAQCWADDPRKPLDYKNELQPCSLRADAPLDLCRHHYEELTGREADTSLPAYPGARVPAAV